MNANQSLPARLAVQDRRRADRSDIDVDTLMCDREGRVFGLKVMNISSTGFMGVVDRPLNERDPVRIDLPFVGWRRADIVWALGDKIGAAFREAVEERSLHRLVADTQL